MPRARFQMTDADIVAAQRQHRRNVSAANPLLTTIGMSLATAVSYMLVAWLLKLWLAPPGAEDLRPIWIGFLVAGVSGLVLRRVFSERSRSNPMWRAPMDIGWDAEGLDANPSGLEPSPGADSQDGAPARRDSIDVTAPLR